MMEGVVWRARAERRVTYRINLQKAVVAVVHVVGVCIMTVHELEDLSRVATCTAGGDCSVRSRLSIRSWLS